jgi:hypothetical protein
VRMSTTDSPAYPVTFDVDYPDHPLNRLTTFFRPFVAIPILIVLALVLGGTYQSDYDQNTVYVAGGGILVAPTVLMLLFRHKYPRWWFDFNRELARFIARVFVYCALLDDRYPSTDEAQGVRFEFDYPDAERDLNRWLPLVKWFLAIPHYIVLAFLWIAAFFVVVVAWFAILFTGRFPRGLHDFVVGVARWHARVAAYVALLVTDRYPPFSLS